MKSLYDLDTFPRCENTNRTVIKIQIKRIESMWVKLQRIMKNTMIVFLTGLGIIGNCSLSNYICKDEKKEETNPSTKQISLCLNRKKYLNVPKNRLQ